MRQANLQPCAGCELWRVSGLFINHDRMAEGKMLCEGLVDQDHHESQENC